MGLRGQDRALPLTAASVTRPSAALREQVAARSSFEDTYPLMVLLANCLRRRGWWVAQSTEHWSSGLLIAHPEDGELLPSLHPEELLHLFWPGVYSGTSDVTPQDQNLFAGTRFFYLTTTFARRPTSSGGRKHSLLKFTMRTRPLPPDVARAGLGIPLVGSRADAGVLYILEGQVASVTDAYVRPNVSRSPAVPIEWPSEGPWLDGIARARARVLPAAVWQALVMPAGNARTELRLFFLVRDALRAQRGWRLHGVWQGGAVDAVMTAEGWHGTSTVQLKSFSLPAAHVHGHSFLVVPTAHLPAEPVWRYYVAVWHVEHQPHCAVVLTRAALQRFRSAGVPSLCLLPHGWTPHGVPVDYRGHAILAHIDLTADQLL